MTNVRISARSILPMHARPCTPSPRPCWWFEPATRPSRPATARLCAVLLLCMTLCWLPARQVLRGAECGARPQDELWLVSARQCCAVSSGGEPRLSAQRLDDDSRWQGADLEALYTPASADQVVVIYIHGNRVPSSAAAAEGQRVYRLLIGGAESAPPLRFVIWSWPSARVRGHLRDVRAKAQRTDVAGYCLAWVLVHLPEDQPVSLLGYSFGARIATGAAHFGAAWRMNPWDHLAGVLIHGEAGGYSARLDGSPYRAGLIDGGLLSAPDRDSWTLIRRDILGPLSG